MPTIMFYTCVFQISKLQLMLILNEMKFNDLNQIKLTIIIGKIMSNNY